MAEKSYEAQVSDAKGRVREVTPREAVEVRARNAGVMFLDVREIHEWNLFHIPGAVLVPLSAFAAKVEDAVPKDQSVIIYCARGNRSALAADQMQRMGYTNVASLAEGIGGWINVGGEVEQ
jgi:rhodanese-related sulfurtransferase